MNLKEVAKEIKMKYLGIVKMTTEPAYNLTVEPAYNREESERNLQYIKSINWLQ